VGSTRPQNGHSKSLNCWITTFAFAGPRNGAFAGGAPIAFFSGSAGPFPSLISVS